MHRARQAAVSPISCLENKTKYCGDRSFEIIDTPGTDSRRDTYQHAFQLRAALTAVSYNTIFIVLEYDVRYENIVQGFLERRPGNDQNVSALWRDLV